MAALLWLADAQNFTVDSDKHLADGTVLGYTGAGGSAVNAHLRRVRQDDKALMKVLLLFLQKVGK